MYYEKTEFKYCAYGLTRSCYRRHLVFPMII